MSYDPGARLLATWLTRHLRALFRQEVRRNVLIQKGSTSGMGRQPWHLLCIARQVGLPDLPALRTAIRCCTTYPPSTSRYSLWRVGRASFPCFVA